MSKRNFNDVVGIGDDIICKLGEKKLHDQDSRLILLIYGEPGSGKTTFSKRLVQYLNEKYGEIDNNNSDNNDMNNFLRKKNFVHEKPIIYQGKGGVKTQICQYTNSNNNISNDDEHSPFAIHLKMDGFHLPLSMLTPKLKLKRGCNESFDSELVVKLFNLLINNDKNSSWSHLTIPDFDHSIKDPVNPGILISNKTKIVVLEGLYLMLNLKPWCEIPNIVKNIREDNKNNNNSIQIIHVIGGNNDETAYRVGLRHLNSGLVSSYEEGIEKYFANDRNNAKIVENQSINDFDDWIIDNSIRLSN